MTNEEAIEKLESRRGLALRSGSNEFAEALDLAIAALRVQPALVAACELALEALGHERIGKENITEAQGARFQVVLYLTAALAALNPTPAKGGTP